MADIPDNPDVRLTRERTAEALTALKAGKSSLFALLTHKLQADQGDVEIPPRWRVGEVAQDMPETDDGATDYVLAGDLPLGAAQRELAAANWKVDYVALRRQRDLRTPTRDEVAAGEPLVTLAAARLGATRLIDNLEI